VTTRKERMLHVRVLEDQAVALICEARRQWWRPLLSRQRRRQARALLAGCDSEFAAIAGAKAKYGRPKGIPPRIPPGAVIVSGPR